MRSLFVAVALLIAGVARAQADASSAPVSESQPAVEPPLNQTPITGPSPSADAKVSPAAMGLIGDIAYQPGVGVRFKTPKTTIVLYGIVEPTLSYVNNANDKGDNRVGFQVSWWSGNRWGITGAQSLVKDDSWRAIFRLESEFELPTGNMDTPNVLFNRDAWGGVQSQILGKLTFGRQNTLARDFSQNYGDAYGRAEVDLEEGGWSNVNNFKQLIFFAGSPTGTRLDNGIVWKRRFGEYIVAGLGYQFGGVAGEFWQNSSGSAALAFNFNPFVVSGYFTGANNHGVNQHSWSIGGNYTLMKFIRLNAGFFQYEANQAGLPHRKDQAWTVSVKVTPVDTGWDLSVGYQRISVENAAYNAGGNIINQFGDTTGSTTAGSGGKGTLYGAIIYHFNRGTQVYVASDWMKLSDGFTTNGAVSGKFGGTRPHNDQIEVATGMRIIF